MNKEIKNMTEKQMETEKTDGNIEHNPDLIAPPIVAPNPVGRPPKVSREFFIRTWNRSRNRAAAAAALGMPATSISAKASLMRKSGVKLKRFQRGPVAKAKA